MTTSMINTVVILCGDVCFYEVFRMRAVLFRTAGQGMRIHWSVFYWVINQWQNNLVLEICIKFFSVFVIQICNA